MGPDAVLTRNDDGWFRVGGALYASRQEGGALAGPSFDSGWGTSGCECREACGASGLSFGLALGCGRVGFCDAGEAFASDLLDFAAAADPAVFHVFVGVCGLELFHPHALAEAGLDAECGASGLDVGGPAAGFLVVRDRDQVGHALMEAEIRAGAQGGKLQERGRGAQGVVAGRSARQTRGELAMPKDRIAWGEIAYEGYRDRSGGKSLVSGAAIPEWSGLSPEMQAAWNASAQGVRQTCINLIGVNHGEPVNEEARRLDEREAVAMNAAQAEDEE